MTGQGKELGRDSIIALFRVMFAQITSGATMVETVQSVNVFLCERVSGEKYVTLTALCYCDGDDVELVNAGHVLPIIRGPGHQLKKIADGDMPAGLMADAVVHAIHFHVELQERIVLISDGISEAENGAEEEFSAHELGRHVFGDEPIQSVFVAVNRLRRRPAA